MKWKVGVIVCIFLSALGFTTSALSQWIHASANIGTAINCFCNSGSNLFAGTLNDPAAVWLSTDSGESWIPKKSNLYNVFGLVSFGTTLFAIAESPSGYQRSTDNGDTWSGIDLGLPTSTYVGSIIPTGSQLLATDSLGRFFISSDNAASWTIVNNGSLGQKAYLLGASGIDLYGGNDSGVFRSTNSGLEWTQILFHFSTRSFVLFGSEIFALSNSYALHSLDNGDHWDTVNVPGSSLISDGNILVAGYRGNASPISISTDNGKSWVNIGAPAGHRLNTLIISGPNIVDGTQSGGLWYHPLHGSSNVKTERLFPDMSLSPNPTTEIITVHNALTNILHVTITNILGESILELEHPNKSDFTLDLSKLPSGTYIARFSLPNQVITRKILKE